MMLLPVRFKYRLRKITLVLIYLFFCSSCSTINMDIIETGPVFPSHKNDIKIYTDKNQVEKTFGAIAILHSDRFDCSLNLQKKNNKNSKK